jgi:hypothetical protein
MAHDSALAAGPVFEGWCIWRSDIGRYWATRARPFSHVAEYAGAARTVDADTLPQLRRSIAEQENTAKVRSRAAEHPDLRRPAVGGGERVTSPPDCPAH